MLVVIFVSQSFVRVFSEASHLPLLHDLLQLCLLLEQAVRKWRYPLSPAHRKDKKCQDLPHVPVRLFGLTLELNGQPDLKFQFKTTDFAMKR